MNTNTTRRMGVSADLIAVQVVNLIPYGEDFDNVDDGYVVSNSSNNNKPHSAGDDIPF
jgi:hypothetical protein